ncbi:DHA2 family efflux MFS transporter permease subunit [Salinispora pacifica]|uniref:DHA2 family efflux MFS transporter permease subunit n=1 Tax=Salinispora pacifica TaxID=351187 RepID=UPI00036C9B5C|nr:DHA2 family efflux MFS transporter permease subunit [Salinispora pacifica]
MNAGTEAETGEGRSWTRAQKWTIVAAGLGVFITLHDVLVANVALPRIQAFYDLGESGLQWIVATYTMGMAIAIMPAATVADRFGRRRLYLTAVVVFIVASVTAGLTSTFTVMLLARGTQGVAAAVITVSALALVSATFPHKRQRFFALGLFAAVADIGLALGPPLGGILTEAASWRVVFFLNVPVAVLVVGLTLRYVAESRESTRRVVDLPGQLLFVITVGAFTFAVIDGHDLGWGSPLILVVFVAFAVGLVAFIVRELRTRSPMMDLRLFTSRAYRLGNMAIFFGFFTVYGALLIVTQYFQNVRLYSPVEAGLLILPSSLASVAVSPVAGFIAARRGARLPALAGQALLVVGLAIMVVGVARSVVAVVLGFLLLGAGLSLIIPPVQGLALNSVPVERAGMASGIIATQRGLGSTAGYAVLGTIVSVWVASFLDGDLSSTIPDRAERAAVVEQIVDDTNPNAFEAIVGPGRPVDHPESDQVTAIRTVADHTFVRGMQLGLGLAALVALIVLVILIRSFRDPQDR